MVAAPELPWGKSNRGRWGVGERYVRGVTARVLIGNVIFNRAQLS